MKLNQSQIESLILILEYIGENESDDFVEFCKDNNPENHIYYHAMKLTDLIETK